VPKILSKKINKCKFKSNQKTEKVYGGIWTQANAKKKQEVRLVVPVCTL
jgi:hypothetical protein